ncbi:NADPH-dependent F420 reductase [Knoellia aerolata]|uniref:NADP oxidoreductase n=1 Tax=Knoellia aerolata DSM 18566 TaxID=1385519 RepID=A0A0A0JXY3_9MICO|nr:NAD(P)-binding domain-containing protein [Knoellia aerolata]KGN42008.1 NADP oxidoreductase [Knoellia aerolata DSM 18566]
MKIAVLGTGMVGQSLADRLACLGHDVVVGTRDPEATRARREPDGMGNPPLSTWLGSHPSVELTTLPEAAGRAEVIVNATNGAGSLDALSRAGAGHLAGKVVIDISNPLDFTAGFPPTLLVKDSDSLGEQIQRAFPDAKVVKTLNTLNAHLMVDPLSLGQDSSVFVSGDDPAAKAVVVDLLESFGHTDVIDLGDITTARGTEMFLPLWLRLMGALRTPAFNVRVVR